MSMFCFQCEQTARGTGCTGSCGVCGKNSSTALLQDKLTGLIIGFALSGKSNPELVENALFTTVTNVNFDDAALEKLIVEVSSFGGEDFDMTQIWNAQEDVKSVKSLILFGLRGMAAYAHHARVLGKSDSSVESFMLKALKALGSDSGVDALLPIALELGSVNLQCMKVLDAANTETYGNPSPVKVSMTIDPGPFIVVTGHDLHDLELLLSQAEKRGVAVYTHGEMLPALAYPKLNKFANFKGHFGTAWQNQQREFLNLPAPVLFTTNCIMPVKPEYADRIFTTGLVQFPGMTHVDSNKDFSKVIDKAIELGGFKETFHGHGINGGTELMTGFGHDAVLSVADKVIEAVKSGAVKHIFLVGGCDGARPGRNYYTEFVKATPPDSLILTLACGKFRFNDLDLGSIGPFPRILDMGQCNDAYSAITVAVALSKAFNCSVNDLPLSLVLSWYEQKAVCILLTLLALGIKNITLGPTLPAFVSPNILKILIENFNLSPTTTPEADLARILS